MDIDTEAEALPKAEIIPKNDQSAEEQPQLASTAAVTTTDAPQVDPQPAGNGRSSLKRPANGELLQDKPEVKRRNQRLFGALLGTLQKFKKEEDATQSSAAAQRRAAMQQAAEQKSKAASAHYLEKTKDTTRLEDNRNRPQQRYLNSGAALRKAPHVSFLLKTSTAPSLSWAPRERCPEVDTLLQKQRIRPQDELEEERPPPVSNREREELNGGGGGDRSRREEEKREVEEEKEEPVVPKEENGNHLINIDEDAGAGPSNSTKMMSESDDGGGWRVVEDVTAEAFK